MATLPSYTAVMDDAFTETFFEVRADAEDNISQSNVISALLKSKGVFTPQVGGTNIERTIEYALAAAPVGIGQSSTLPVGTTPTETAAFWNRDRQTAANVQRNTLKDAENAGAFRIKDYVAKRLKSTMKSLKQQDEADWLRAHVTSESTALHLPQGLCDVVPPPATRATGTWGGIARPTNFTNDIPDAGNTFWTPKYKVMAANPEINLITDMENAHNTVNAQQSAPDIILTSQTLYEMFGAFGFEATQVLSNERILSLGFANRLWNGTTLTWANGMAASAVLTDGTTAGYAGLTHAMLFLNSNDLEVVYDPNLYYYMTEWQWLPRTTDKVCWVIVKKTVISDQPRRHLLLYTA